MIISEKSVLRNLPLLEERQLLTLDSLRFTVDMIEYSHENLFNRLTDLSTSGKQKNYPQIFMYCWTMIDATRRFVKLYKTLPFDSEHNNIKRLDYINSPRNTYQHLEERINESILDARKPFYGIIKWVYHNDKTRIGENHLAISGIHYTQEYNFNVAEFKEELTISDIILETVDKKTKTEISISKLITDIKEVVKPLEKGMEDEIKMNGLKLYDWKSTRDVFFKFVGH